MCDQFLDHLVTLVSEDLDVLEEFGILVLYVRVSGEVDMEEGTSHLKVSYLLQIRSLVQSLQKRSSGRYS